MCVCCGSLYTQGKEQDANVVRAWMMTNGAILCVDQSFMDYAGWVVQVRGEEWWEAEC
jgi:hypothetical protein